MSSSVVYRSAVVGDDGVDRLDAEFFDVTYSGLEAGLAAQGAKPLGEFASLQERSVRDPRKEASGPGDLFTYIEISDVDTRDGFVVVDQIPKLEAPTRARQRIRQADLVLSSVRPARNAVFLVTDDYDKAICSTGFVVLAATSGLSSAVLFTFLKTRVAVMQLERRARASMYPALHPPDVLNILVPEISVDLQRRVETLIDGAREQRDLFLAAQSAAKEGAEAFFDQMGPEMLLKDLRAPQPRTLKRSGLFGDASPGRMDAEFHAAAFVRLAERMQAIGEVRTLGEITGEVDTGRTPAAAAYTDDDEGGAVVIKVGTLSNLGLKWSDVEFAPRKYRRPDSEARVGDVLFTSSAHSPAHISRKADVVTAVPPEFDGRTSFVGELMRLRVTDASFPPAYLVSFLRHPIGGEQVRRCTRGITSHVYPDDIRRDVLIPVPPPEVAAAVAFESERAEGARREYYALTREAIALLDAETGLAVTSKAA